MEEPSIETTVATTDNLLNFSVQLPSINNKQSRKHNESPDFQFQTIGLAGKYMKQHRYQDQDFSTLGINNNEQMLSKKVRNNSFGAINHHKLSQGGGSNNSYLNPFSIKKTTEREGSIRLVNQIGAPFDSNYSPLKNENSMSEIKNMKHVKKRFGTVNNSIDIKRGALNHSSLDPLTKTYITSLDPLSDKTLDNSQVVIRDLPPTLRYLTKNAFASTHASPRENSKEVITNIRQIFYAQMSIESKKEETLKLREYIIMEQEKLEDAKRVFEEDQDKFQKYMNEMESQAEKARDGTEKSSKEKIELGEYFEKLQQDIHKYEREIIQVDDDLKQAVLYKDFIDLVKAQRKFKHKNIQEGQKSSKHHNKDEKADNFFITEEALKLMHNDSSVEEGQSIFNNQGEEVDLSKNEFLDIIQSLEDANIFLLDNIQNEEQDMEKFDKQAEDKYNSLKVLIDEIQQNIDMYQSKIADKKTKKQSIQGYIKGFGKNIAGQDELSLQKRKSKIDLGSGILKNGVDGVSKPIDFRSQMTNLKVIIAKLHAKVKGVVTSQQQPQDDVVQQLSEIERRMSWLLERRDLIITNQGGNDQSEAQLKQLQEVEKIVDKDRKQIRYEKKRKIEMEQMREKQLKVEKRMERSHNSSKNHNSTKQMMVRSNKPEVVKIIHDPNKNITQEELDYKRYVDSIAQSNQQTGNTEKKQ
eukprot:403360600